MKDFWFSCQTFSRFQGSYPCLFGCTRSCRRWGWRRNGIFIAVAATFLDTFVDNANGCTETATDPNAVASNTVADDAEFSAVMERAELGAASNEVTNLTADAVATSVTNKTGCQAAWTQSFTPKNLSRKI